LTFIADFDILRLSLTPISVLAMKQILTHSATAWTDPRDAEARSKRSQSALAAKLAISQNVCRKSKTNPGNLTVERLLELANLLAWNW